MPVQLLLNLVDFLKCPTLSEKHSRQDSFALMSLVTEPVTTLGKKRDATPRSRPHLTLDEIWLSDAH